MTPPTPIAKSYGLRVIQAETAWDTTKGAASTIVAVVDSGLSMVHPEFVGPGDSRSGLR